MIFMIKTGWINYMEEEPGCDVYYTNDQSGEWFPERFLLDGEEVHEYFETYLYFQQLQYVHL